MLYFPIICLYHLKFSKAGQGRLLKLIGNFISNEDQIFKEFSLL